MTDLLKNCIVWFKQQLEITISPVLDICHGPDISINIGIYPWTQMSALQSNLCPHRSPSLTVCRAMGGGKLPPPLPWRNILKYSKSARKRCNNLHFNYLYILWHLLPQIPALLVPPVATDWSLVIDRLAPSNQYLNLKDTPNSKIKDYILGEKHAGNIHFWWNSIFSPQKTIFTLSAWQMKNHLLATCPCCWASMGVNHFHG